MKGVLGSCFSPLDLRSEEKSKENSLRSFQKSKFWSVHNATKNSLLLRTKARAKTLPPAQSRLLVSNSPRQVREDHTHRPRRGLRRRLEKAQTRQVKHKLFAIIVENLATWLTHVPSGLQVIPLPLSLLASQSRHRPQKNEAQRVERR